MKNTDRSSHPEPSKTKIRLMMDSDVRAFFMAQDNYEQKINRILQDFVEEQKRKNESGT